MRPAHLIAAALTLPQLLNGWPNLKLSNMLRAAWEDAYPALVDDLVDFPRLCKLGGIGEEGPRRGNLGTSLAAMSRSQ
jgi:hypothetical protein